METVEKILLSKASQMRGTEEAGPGLRDTPTPPRQPSHFIGKWRLTLICCVKPQKKKKEGGKTHPSALQGEVPTLSSPAKDHTACLPLKTMEQFPPSAPMHFHDEAKWLDFRWGSAHLPSCPYPLLCDSRGDRSKCPAEEDRGSLL